MKKILTIKNNVLCKIYDINWREHLTLIACLLIFTPVGLYQMWKHSRWNVVAKSIITGSYMILLLIIFLKD